MTDLPTAYIRTWPSAVTIASLVYASCSSSANSAL